MRKFMIHSMIFALGLLWGLLPAWDCAASGGGGDGTYLLCAVAYGIACNLFWFAPLIYVVYAFLLWYYPHWSLWVFLFDIGSVFLMVLGIVADPAFWGDWTHQTEVLYEYWQCFGLCGFLCIFAAKTILLLAVIWNIRARRKIIFI